MKSTQDSSLLQASLLLLQPPMRLTDKAKSKFDTDGDGDISAEELAAAPEKAQAKLKEHDKDGDGALSKEEYAACKAAMKKKGGEKKLKKHYVARVLKRIGEANAHVL